MRSLTIALGALSLLALGACSDNSNSSSTTPAATSTTPATGTATTPAPATGTATTPATGTTGTTDHAVIRRFEASGQRARAVPRGLFRAATQEDGPRALEPLSSIG